MENLLDLAESISSSSQPSSPILAPSSNATHTNINKDNPLETFKTHERIRKASHSAIERRRRSVMNEKIMRLRSLLPIKSQNMRKLDILQCSIDYIIELQQKCNGVYNQGQNLNQDVRTNLPKEPDYEILSALPQYSKGVEGIVIYTRSASHATGNYSNAQQTASANNLKTLVPIQIPATQKQTSGYDRTTEYQCKSNEKYQANVVVNSAQKFSNREASFQPTEPVWSPNPTIPQYRDSFNSTSFISSNSTQIYNHQPEFNNQIDFPLKIRANINQLPNQSIFPPISSSCINLDQLRSIPTPKASPENNQLQTLTSTFEQIQPRTGNLTIPALSMLSNSRMSSEMQIGSFASHEPSFQLPPANPSKQREIWLPSLLS
ncbi:hypothetical protein HK096_003157 [Nowakowskiella sp. JEL0078]|nr:hypothetical protein HK096_003157 [Nowakowskiella sp. JEL0078]